MGELLVTGAIAPLNDLKMWARGDLLQTVPLDIKPSSRGQ